MMDFRQACVELLAFRYVFAVIAVLLIAPACGTTTTAIIGERHVIRPIPRLDTQVRSGMERGTGAESNEGSKSTVQVKATEEKGVWFWRIVKRPNAARTDMRLQAIEILFCPAAESDFAHCRVGVAWSRGTHPLGQLGEK